MAGKAGGDRRKGRGGKGAKPQAPVKTITVGVIDYKDVQTLKRFISERGKIRARRITGVSVQSRDSWPRPSRTPVKWRFCHMPGRGGPKWRR